MKELEYELLPPDTSEPVTEDDIVNFYINLFELLIN